VVRALALGAIDALNGPGCSPRSVRSTAPVSMPGATAGVRACRKVRDNRRVESARAARAPFRSPGRSRRKCIVDGHVVDPATARRATVHVCETTRRRPGHAVNKVGAGECRRVAAAATPGNRGLFKSPSFGFRRMTLTNQRPNLCPETSAGEDVLGAATAERCGWLLAHDCYRRGQHACAGALSGSPGTARRAAPRSPPCRG